MRRFLILCFASLFSINAACADEGAGVGTVEVAAIVEGLDGMTDTNGAAVDASGGAFFLNFEALTLVRAAEEESEEGGHGHGHVSTAALTTEEGTFITGGPILLDLLNDPDMNGEVHLFEDDFALFGQYVDLDVAIAPAEDSGTTAEGFALLIEGSIDCGGSTPDLSVQLDEEIDGLAELELDFEVRAGESTELPIELDVAGLFAGVDLCALETAGAVVLDHETNTADLGIVLGNLSGAFAVEAHDHAHE